MKTVITYEIDGPQVEEMEDAWNRKHSKPEADSMAGGYISLTEYSALYQEFHAFYKKFLTENPNSVTMEVLRRDIIYSEADKKKFDIFSCVIGRKIVFNNKDFNEHFKYVEECPICKRSICVQKNDIIIKTSKLKKDFNEITYLQDAPLHSIAWIVSAELKAILEELNCRVRFQNIIDKENKMISQDFFQLHVDYIYPPSLPPTKIDHEQFCPVCQKYKKVCIGEAFCVNSSELYFPRPEIIPDIGRTEEKFGEQSFLNESRSSIIISQRLSQIIKKRKIKNLYIEHPDHFI